LSGGFMAYLTQIGKRSQAYGYLMRV